MKHSDDAINNICNYKKLYSKILLCTIILPLVLGCLLILFSSKLPFLLPELIFICCAAVVSNSIILVLLYVKKDFIAHIHMLLPISNIIYFPLVSYCSGSFITPFVLLLPVFIMFFASIHNNNQKLLRMLFLCSIFFYNLIPITMKVGLINNYVTFSSELMHNNYFFYLILFIVNTILFSSYLISVRINRLIRQQVVDIVKVQNDVKQQLVQSQKLEALGQLSGGIAHDFNNMLSGIMGYSQLLNKKLANDTKLNKYPQKIIAITKKAAALTSQLLTFARKEEQNHVSIDVNKLISDIVNMLEHTIARTIAIDMNLATGNLLIMGNSTQLENSLINLAVNARDAMPFDGTISFETFIKTFECDTFVDEISPHNTEDSIKQGEYIGIKVSDTGGGINSEILPHIFEPFFTTKQSGKGTGLGLAAVYGCIKNHNAIVTVKSVLGQGSTFTILIPRLVGKLIKPLLDETGIIDRSNCKLHIMVVDDEIDIVDTVSEILREYDFSVTSFQDSSEALTFFKENYKRIDVLLIDMQMPVINGRELFYAIRKINPKIVVIVMTGNAVEEDTQDILKQPYVAGLLEKPFNPSRIVKLINKQFDCPN